MSWWTILAVAVFIAGVFSVAAETTTASPLQWGIRCSMCLIGGYLLATLGVA